MKGGRGFDPMSQRTPEEKLELRKTNAVISHVCLRDRHLLNAPVNISGWKLGARQLAKKTDKIPESYFLPVRGLPLFMALPGLAVGPFEFCCSPLLFSSSPMATPGPLPNTGTDPTKVKSRVCKMPVLL